MSEDTTTSGPIYAPEAYSWLQPGHGAAKLSGSAVAPLVAAARGYRTVTKDTFDDAVEALDLSPRSSIGAKQLKKAIAGEDAMVMPWYRMDMSLENARRGTKANHSALQFRPRVALVADDGTAAKYINIKGVPTVLDVHPATPADWFDSAPRILLTEGIMKGDATLAALLREHVDKDLLSIDHGGDPVSARLALRKLMEQVPADQRTLIISFVGVSNWRANPEWLTTNLRDREAWIAYDADVSVNYQVWKQANDLVDFLEDSRHAKTPRLIKLPPVAGDPKAGLDDFFAAPAEHGGGSFSDLAHMLTEMPSAPSTDAGGEDEGAIRVHPDGHSVEESVAVTDAAGRTIGTRWKTVVGMGGRIKSFELSRAATDEEIKTGFLGRGIGSEGDPRRSKESNIEIEIMWRDPADPDNLMTGTVTGPSNILSFPPKEWLRQGAQVPAHIQLHQEWPPKEGEKFLYALKGYRTDEIEDQIRWSTMGWVPTAHGTPKFIIGNQVIDSTGISEDESGTNGVTEQTLSGADDFGVLPTPQGEDGEEVDWLAQAREDFEEVWDAYIASGAWTDKNVAATVLALGLRPALPLPCSTVAYMVGRPRSGKSWSAAATMGFWTNKIPGTWNNNHLPGKATDTVASMENAVSRTTIWVADDLAPSTDARTAKVQEAALGDLIRSVFNRSGKRRMKADMTARDVNRPKALLILTAENEPSVHSVSERIVRLTFGSGSLNADRTVTNRVVDAYTDSGAPARLTGAFIRWAAWKATQLEGGWEQLYTHWASLKEALRAEASQIIGGTANKGNAERHATIASDLMIVFDVLADFAQDLGVSEHIREALMDEMKVLIAHQVAAAHDAQESSAPGRAVIEAVATLLRSGQGHIGNAERVTSAPSTDDLRNLILGWVPGAEEGQMRPTGRTIGWLLQAKDGGGEVALLDPKTAFNEAQRAYPDIIPYGNKSAQGWAAVWDEGLALDVDHGGWARRRNGRYLLHTVDVTVDGTRLRGVPVPISVLIGSTTSANLSELNETSSPHSHEDGDEGEGEEPIAIAA